jgi:hypothetical protein
MQYVTVDVLRVSLFRLPLISSDRLLLDVFSDFISMWLRATWALCELLSITVLVLSG